MNKTRQPRKQALLIGIDRYQHPRSNLNGCVNDITAISSQLQLRFGYTADHLMNGHATGENIRAGIRALLTSDADELLIYYSGHGSQVHDNNGDEVDGMDEIICPHDFPDDYLTDDTLNLLFQLKKESVPLTVIFDCCHSGTGHRDIADVATDSMERFISFTYSTQSTTTVSVEYSKDPQTTGAQTNKAHIHKIAPHATGPGPGTQTDTDTTDRNATNQNITFIGACGDAEVAREIMTPDKTTHGAFTWSLLSILKNRKEKQLPFDRPLVSAIQNQLDEMNINQHPEIHFSE